MEIKVIDFIEKDWEFERSSGYGGYRNVNECSKHYNTWIYDVDKNRMVKLRKEYESDLQLLCEFRTEVLPFGEYPDIKLREFLDKKYKSLLIS